MSCCCCSRWDPLNMVTTGCPKSQFKDNRHDWISEAGPGIMLSCMVTRWFYEVRKCRACNLVVVIQTNASQSLGRGLAPHKDDDLIYAWYEVPKAGATT